MGKIYNQVAIDRVYVCPVVVLESESYWHPKWAKDIFKPVFRLVGWANMNGELKPDETEQPALPLEQSRPLKDEMAGQAPAKAVKPPLEAVQPAAEPVAPVSTVQARVGQRRRPGPR